MQFPTDTDLAAALAPGQVRRFRVRFMVDWQRNGAYADANSDLSRCFVEATVDRQLVGNYPDELEVTEGNAAAQVSVLLEGNAPDGTSLVRLFSPYAGLYPGTVAAIGTPCYLDVIVVTATGEVTIRQFTGVVRNSEPSRRDGSVTLTLRDAAENLRAPIDLACWAVDGYTKRRLAANFPDADDCGKVTLSWLVDHVLRRSGWMQGPAWHPGAVLAWTMNGSALPEIGHFGITDQYVTGTYDFGYGLYQVPNRAPAGTPSGQWAASPYGMAYRGTRATDWASHIEDNVVGNAHASARINPLSYGSNNSNLLGFSWQVFVDSSLPNSGGDPSEILFHCEDIRYNYGDSNRYPAYAQLLFYHATGQVRLRFYGDGWTKSWDYQGFVPNPGTARWVNMFALLQFTSGALQPYVVADGQVLTLTQVGTVYAWPPPAMSYTWPVGATNHGRVTAGGPMNYAQVYYQNNTTIAGNVWPTFTPPARTAKVDLSTLRLTWIPKLRRQVAWELLRDLAAADLGALFVTEQGVPTFESRSTVKARQNTNNVALRLTLDQVQELAPRTVLESVVNYLTWDIQTKTAEIANNQDPYPTGIEPVFSATKPDQFPIAGSSSRTQVLTLADSIMQVRQGAVTYRPAAMGYTLGGGANTAWQLYMQYYAPKYWGDGFTPYRPGSRTDPNSQPVPNTGTNCNVALGFQDYTDQDPAHIRLFLSNSNTNTSWFAVDDSTPFLNVGGVRIIDQDNDAQALQDSVSVARYGFRSFPLGGGVWLQDSSTVLSLANSLLNDLSGPRPFFEALDLPGDPRVQLQDVVRVDDAAVIGGPVFASIVGIRRTISVRDGLKDSYTLRTFGAQGGLWIMDDPDYSVIDRSTIVS